MNQEYDKQVLTWFNDLTDGSIEEERISEILSKLGDHFDYRNALAQALIHHINSIPDLTHLNLSWNQIGDGDAAALAQGLRHVSNLTFLDLSFNQIGYEGAAALAKRLHHVPNLRILSLNVNPIGVEGAAALAKELHHVPKLKYLGLSGNQIGYEGASALAQELHHVPNLEYLDLGDNEIGDEGFSFLSYLLPSVVMTGLYLDKRIHPAILSYLLFIHSELPFYDLLRVWMKTFKSTGNEKEMRYLLSR